MTTGLTPTQAAFFATCAGVAATLLLSSSVGIAALTRRNVDQVVYPMRRLVFFGYAAFAAGALCDNLVVVLALHTMAQDKFADRDLLNLMIGLTLAGLLAATIALGVVAGVRLQRLVPEAWDRRLLIICIIVLAVVIVVATALSAAFGPIM